MGIISHLQLSVRSESSLKNLLSHYLYKAAKAANNSLRLHALAATAYQVPWESGSHWQVKPSAPAYMTSWGKKTQAWLTQGYSHFSNTDPEIHLHEAMQKILRDKNESWNTQAQLRGIQ